MTTPRRPKVPSFRRTEPSRRVRSSGRVKTVSPPPSGDLGDPFQALLPDVAAANEVESLRAEVLALRRLQEVIHFLGGAPDLASLRSEVLDLATSMTELRRGMLCLRVSSADDVVKFKVAEARGYDDKHSREVKVLRGILNRALEAREILLEGDILEGGILGHAARSGKLRLGAVACLPLVSGGDLHGALLLDDPERRRPFSTAEQSLLRSFARHVALAIQRLAESRRARRKAEHLERRAERLAAEREQLQRQSSRMLKLPSSTGASSTELDALFEYGYAEAKEVFTRRYLKKLLRRAGGDLRAASQHSGLPLARLIGLLNHLEIDPGKQPGSGRTATGPASGIGPSSGTGPAGSSWGRAARQD